MTDLAHDWLSRRTEILAVARKGYEHHGFDFFSPPRSHQLPSSFGSYMPPAVAFKGDKKVVVDIWPRQDWASQYELTDIREKLVGQPGWRLDVIYAPRSSEEELVIEPAQPQAIRNQLAEVSALSKMGHRRPAFVLAWSLLEAAANSRADPQEPRRVYTPGQLAQHVATSGYIDPEADRRLRGLVPLCLRILHGDLNAVPSAEELHAVVDAVEATLTMEDA